MKFRSLGHLILKTAQAIRPPERLSVAEAAEKYRKLNNPGSYIGDWDNDIAPYLVEPMETLTSIEHTGMVFVGPARTGKSDMFFNWLGHTAICDPADMGLYHMTQASARDWSVGDLQKMFRHSPDIGAQVLGGRHNMNVHDVRFISGMRLLIKWPTITELSGKTLRYVWMMDYDRMPDDVDKEGAPFDLGRKRTTTFGRYGMTVAESSPGREIENPRWQPTSPHEAPPAKGILGLYNRGDRRRWYWNCISCGTPFEGDFKHLNYPDSRDKAEAAAMVTLDCPYCHFSHTHEPGPGQPGKQGLNQAVPGWRWIRDNMRWDRGEARWLGEPRQSDIGSFWLKGTAAAFVDWPKLVLQYLTAYEEYEKTGGTETLKATITTDQGLPFTPPSLDGERLPEDLKDTAEDLGDRVVPEGVRFLNATIDVQKSKFVVQVHGFGVGGEIWIVDRFDVRKSERRDADGERLWVSPGVYEEDWRILIGAVVEKAYPLGDGSGRLMKIKVVGSDMQGKEGVAVNAYNFWRWLRDTNPAQHHRRFQLIRGDPSKSAPRIRITFPDSSRKDRRAAGRGEVPVLQISPDKMKDMVSGILGRKSDEGISLETERVFGRIHYPDWLDASFYSELTAETRTTKGWENPKNLRNEAWDLLCYAVALALSRHVNIEKLDWEKPPGWAKPWDENDMVFREELGDPFAPQTKLPVIDMAEIADALG